MYRRRINHLSQPTNQERPPRFLHYHHYSDHNLQFHGQTLLYLLILFSITLLVTLLLLYARWYFRFRHAHHHHHHRHYPHSHPHAPPHAPPYEGVDSVAIKSIILHQQGIINGREDEIMECCICLGVFEDGDKVKVLPKCDHRFHSDCVDRWLVTQLSCPLCRLSFRVDPSLPDSVITIPPL